jgi:probable addiction module antidote protein
MKKITEIEGIKIENAEVLDMDFSEYYANYLKKNPKKLKNYKKHIVTEYNKTKNAAVFLESLKTVAMAERKMSELAKVAKIERSSVYKILSKEANPSFYTIVSLAHNLGMDFRLSTLAK